jgi:two-component system, NarL family, nitrate/nitrite response regulator NarL
MEQPIKIILLDTPNLVSDGLAFVLRHTHGFELTGQFSSLPDLLAGVDEATLGPDLFIVDVELPGMDGIQAAKILKSRFPLTKLLILTLREETYFINRAILVGADGYVLKNATRAIFEEAVKRVLSNCEFVCGQDLKDLTQSESGITTREEAILRLVAQGKSSKDIASVLFISSRTVDTHRNNLKRKLGLQTSGELVRYAFDHGLL